MPPMEATVGEIHAYPLRPEGYAEPLFHSARSRRQILEHLAESNWLGRASELEPPRRGEIPGDPTVCVLATWREVDHWWEPGGGVDLVWRLVEDRWGRQRMRAEQHGGRAAAPESAA